MTSKEWNLALANPDGEHVLAVIEAHARAKLTKIRRGYAVATPELAEMLYPMRLAKGVGIDLRHRLVLGLIRLSETTMAANVYTGPLRQCGTRRIRPKYWFNGND